MTSQTKAFEDNKVLLWGEHSVKKSLLDEYDKGNKNPNSTLRKKKADEVVEKKIVKKREFEVGGDYGVGDLDFLNKEYDRIDNEMSKPNVSMEEMDELMDIQEKLADLIEGLEHFKKISGSSIKQGGKIHYVVSSTLDDDFIGGTLIKQLVGKGFKKGSPEAIAHAEKMRKALDSKKPKVDKTTIKSKARVEKGSEEAKALGQRLAEARKKKKTIVEVKQEPVKKITGKPWFYIGDIPKGYREATEDEAILAKKVSEYGKYVVDSEKWRLFRDYDILLSDKKTDREIEWSMNGLKRRIMDSLKEIEILSSKLDNEKHKTKHNEIKFKLDEEKEKRKYLQAGWNWYNKLVCEKEGKPYERQKFTLPVKEIKHTVTKEEYKPLQRPIDPRTGKEAEMYIPEEEKKENKKQGIVDVDLYFENGKDLITLSTKYFTQDYKLKPAYAKKLTDKGIILQKKYYTTDDYSKYFYRMQGDGIFKQIK